ncbi:MAG: hypothetical protein LC130_15780 [Bryobacterales bacterium]|nr:hypothetical protein [Bryobacterales bacterium]MEB2360229.1 hypothetical protein [Bryobacterales bacterium]
MCRPSARASMRWVLFAALAIWCLVAYLVIVLPLDENLFPALNRWPVAITLAPFSLGAVFTLVNAVHRKTPLLSIGHLKNIALLSIVTLCCFVTIDLLFKIQTNVAAGAITPDQVRSAQLDGYLWDSELHPRVFFPTKESFYLYKPNSVMEGYSYGAFYSSNLLNSPLLAKSVLELRHVTFAVNKYGLRETHDPAGAAIFALGDSFCFGQHVEQDAGWVEKLQSILGETVINLGISGSSPRQQYLALNYLLRKYPEAFKPQHLLWMIFEGNDLEDGYGNLHVPLQSSRIGAVLGGTVIETFARIPGQLREESVLRLLMMGKLKVGGVAAKPSKQNHHYVEGQRLQHPLYYSSRFGYRLFEPTYMVRAALPESYVINHPHRKALDETFHQMRELSRRAGFRVTVLLVPSGARLYNGHFDDMPPVSPEPYFLNYVQRLCSSMGFASADLHALLQPYAEKELLYQRDDSHWNERGNAVVAELVARQIFER